MTAADELLLGRYLILYPLAIGIGSLLFLDLVVRACRRIKKGKSVFTA